MYTALRSSFIGKQASEDQVEFEFFSDWAGVSTPSNAALDLSDGGKWDSADGNDRVQRIISAAGLDFPTLNVLETGAEFPEASPVPIIQKGTLSIPGIGESRYYRFYIRVVLPDSYTTTDWQTHPIQVGNAAGDSIWMFIINNRPEFTSSPFGSSIPAGHYSAEIWFDQGGTHWYFPFLPKHETHRFELKVTRDTSTTLKAEMRVYDSSGTLLYDSDDVIDFDDNVQSTFYASNSTTIGTSVNSFAVLNCGNNGVGGTAATDEVLTYQGAFGVRTDDWCGPYGNGIGESL